DADQAVRSTSDATDPYITDYFYDRLEDRLNELGSVGPVLTYAYDDPAVEVGMPMDMGDTLRDDYCFWSDGLDQQFHYCGASYVTFDAKGTLVLPYGTFTDVLHVTRSRAITETTLPDPDTSYAIQQRWYAPGVPHPILLATLFLSSDGVVYPSGRMMGEASVAAIDEEAAAMDWTVYPNPASDRVTLTREGTASADVHVLALDGRLLARQALREGEQRVTLDLAALPEGAYLVQVITKDRRTARTLIKTTR
ncbi:MAG TPA: T9SS type A sorting domain-containing protein, partial [Flavobacteriales bacterium]|nr:T9SS type A sorting domain-containing protein [Flavobacteriales bacterium]